MLLKGIMKASGELLLRVCPSAMYHVCIPHADVYPYTHATDPSEPLYANLKIATDQIEKVANEINTSIHMREARQRVISVQNHLENCTMPLVTPTRYHVKDGPLNKKYNNSSFKISSFNRYW